MSAVQHIRETGVNIFLVGDRVRLEGLAALPPDQARRLVDFARQHKAVLLEELAEVPRQSDWQPLGPAEHPGSGETGTLVRHKSGRLALGVGRCLLTVGQDWAAEQARECQK
jgi:hypothetical protein